VKLKLTVLAVLFLAFALSLWLYDNSGSIYYVDDSADGLDHQYWPPDILGVEPGTPAAHFLAVVSRLWVWILLSLAPWALIEAIRYWRGRNAERSKSRVP
jgi:hypothetical protein